MFDALIDPPADDCDICARCSGRDPECPGCAEEPVQIPVRVKRCIECQEPATHEVSSLRASMPSENNVRVCIEHAREFVQGMGWELTGGDDDSFEAFCAGWAAQ